MMALDQFVLWVNADTPYKTPQEYIDAVKKAGANKFKMGGTGSKQEDQIITVASRTDRRQVHLHPLQGRRRDRRAAGRQAHRFLGEQPDRGGRAVARRRVASAVRVRRPADAVLGKVTKDMAWGDIPTCKKMGLDVEYQMLRASSCPPSLQGPGRFSTWRCSRRCARRPSGKEFMEKGAFNQTALGGNEYKTWVTKEEQRHYNLMKEAGFLAAGK